jgi:hypothetical protein
MSCRIDLVCGFKSVEELTAMNYLSSFLYGCFIGCSYLSPVILLLDMGLPVMVQAGVEQFCLS